MRIVRVTKDEFELEDGASFPIIPPLQEVVSVEEFQRCYDCAAQAVRGCSAIGGDCTDITRLGPAGEDQN